MKTRIVAVAALLALASCGGGSDTLHIQGVWSGDYDPNGPFNPVSLHAVIQDGGTNIWFDNQGYVYVLSPIGGGNLETTANLYPPYGFIFTGNQPSLPSSIKGDVSNNNMSGKLFINGAFADFDLKPATPFGGNASVVGGLWSGNYIGGLSPSNLALHVNSNGSFSGSDAYGCTMQGTLTQLRQGGNLFAVMLTSRSSFSAICAGSMTGLAYESSADALNLFGHAAGTYYYVSAYSANGAFVAELKVQ